MSLKLSPFPLHFKLSKEERIKYTFLFYLNTFNNHLLILPKNKQNHILIHPNLITFAPVSFRKKIVGLIIGFITILLSTSCGSYKKVVYFQGEDSDSIVSPNTYTPVFKKDDYITVTVSADDPETAVPFNYPTQAGGGMQQQMMQGGRGGVGPPNIGGYLVDEEGYIELPIIGKIEAAGKSRTELKEELKSIYKQYLSSPTVDIMIRNFKITVLGDIGGGIIQVTTDRITILEAIGAAGDLPITGKRKNILVIRERDGIKQEYRVDITSKDIFNSPVYYLEQNDIIYVEPNAVARAGNAYWLNVLPSVLSLGSFVFTTILLITN
jgi:polysaccharide export outer membrane protein